MGFPHLRLSRRQWIQTIAGTTCGIAGGLTTQSLISASQSLSQAHLHIGTPALPNDKALRIVQLSDLHLRDIGALETMLLTKEFRQVYKLIMFTPEMVQMLCKLQM